MNIIKEQDILDKSKLALKHLFGNEILIEDKYLSESNNNSIDGYLKINANSFSYIIISNPTLGKVTKEIRNINKLNNEIKNPLIVTDYASQELIDLLKSENFFFIDSIGNCYINLPDFKMLVEGRKNSLKPKETKKAFQKTGLKLIFELLLNPSLTSANYREIAQKTGISLGSVSAIFEELKEDRFIIDISSSKKNLSNIKRLITKWANGYGGILRPKIHRGFFTSFSKFINRGHFFNEQNYQEDDIFIGGEYAAYYLNDYIKPNKVILYTNERLSKMAVKYKIVPTGKQDNNKIQIEIFEKFWSDSDIVLEHTNSELSFSKDKKLVNEILIYADLISSNDYRSFETAEKILNNEIRNKFVGYNLQW